MNKTYMVNEIFYSIQGEGVRAGTPNVFIRFSGCNLKCSEDDPFSGFNCDTEFVSGVKMTAGEIVGKVLEFENVVNSQLPIILTGGEPTLQIDEPLLKALLEVSPLLAIETNGTKEVSDLIKWICVSPKSAEHTLKVKACDELKYVRHAGQGLPKPSVQAGYYLLSPAFNADGSLSRENLRHCVELVKQNPAWQLSLQLHKFLGVR